MPYVGFPMIYESPPWIFAAQIYFHWYICLAPPTHWFMRCILPDWWTCLLKGETNHKCKLLNISKDHFQNSLQIRFVQIEKYVCPAPLHVSKGHLQNTDTGRNLFPRGCQQKHGSDPLQGPENNRWWRTHGKSPSRQQTNLLFCCSPQPRRAARWTLYGSGSTDRGGTISPSLPSFGEFNLLFQFHSLPFYIVFVDLRQRYNAKNKQRLGFNTHWHPSDNQNAGTKDQINKRYILLISDGDQTRWSVVPPKSIVPFPLCSHFLSLLFNTLSNHPLHHTLLVRTHFRKLKANQIQRKIIGRLSYLNTSQSSGKLISLKCSFSI